MKVFEIWSEGYHAQGEHGIATLHAKMIAPTFDEAVEKYIEHRRTTNWPDIHKCYQKMERFISCPVSDEFPLGRKLAYVHSLWGCRLFDNESDARNQCG